MVKKNMFYIVAGSLFVTIFVLNFMESRRVGDLEQQLEKSTVQLMELRQELSLLRSELDNLKIREALTISEQQSKKMSVPVISKELSHFFSEDSDVNQSTSDVELESTEAEVQLSDFEQGKRALAKGFYETAIKHLEKVNPASEEYVDSRMDMAAASFFSGQYAIAADAYEEVLKHLPDSVEALIGLANTYNRTGNKGEQIAAYTKAIALEPKQWLHYNSRGAALYQNGNFDEAIEDFLEAASLARHSRADQALALENIGLVHLSREKWHAAFQHTSSVNNVDSSRSWNWLIRGIAAMKLSYSHDAWLAFENWFKFRRATDPFLIKQFLPETLKEFAELTPKQLTRLINPPIENGLACVNDAQCASGHCAHGAPDNTVNFCAGSKMDCGLKDSAGYKAGQKIKLKGDIFRCYLSDTGSGRWTIDDSSG